MPLITDPDQLNQGVEINIDTGLRTFTLNSGSGNLDNDGVTLQALYSFFKEEWKNDNALNPHPFPMVAITPEQFEFIEDWQANNDTTRKLLRTGGWREIDEFDTLQKEYAGITTLGSFEDPVNDLAYYQVGNDPTDTGAAIDFDFAGPVNEGILTYELNLGPVVTPNGFDFNDTSPDTIDRNDGGSFITDGYVVGGQVTVINATNATNNGTYVITAVSAGTLTVEAVGGGDAGLVTDTDDNTAQLARNYRNAFTIFLRVRDADPNGKTYAQATLADAGETALFNKKFAFPLSNSTDLKISETDANISANTPYTQIDIRYFDQAFSRDVDSPGTPRDFGIVIDVGTFSGVDGSTSGGGSVLTTAEGGIPATTYDGGTLIIHEGPDAGTYTITTASGTTVNISGTFPTGSTNQSFTLQRSSPVVATAEEIYEKIQFELRQAADIDSTDQIVTGKTADELLRFVGDTLEAGQGLPTNPNGGGSGVIIEGFDSNDTNRLTFFDNTGTARTFPFVAAGSINFNANLVNDSGPAIYRMFFTFTEQFTNTGFGLSAAAGSSATLDSSVTDLVAELANGDYIKLDGFTDPNNNGVWQLTGAPTGTGPWSAPITKVDGETVSNEAAGPTVSLDKNPIDSPDAIVVNDNGGSPIEGNVPGPTAAFDFDYDNNVQGGRTAGTDADVTIRAIGLDTAQFVETNGLITRSVGQVFTLVAGLERNYSNP